MASKQPSITDVLRGLRQAALASLSEAGLSTHRVNLSVGLRLQMTRSGLRWLPCVDADVAQHRFEVEVDVDAEPHTPWPPLDSAPVALGEANDAEQLEHRLREEFEQLASQMPTSHRKLGNKKTLPKGKPKKKSPKITDTKQFEITQSEDYWKLILRSHQAMIALTKQKLAVNKPGYDGFDFAGEVPAR